MSDDPQRVLNYYRSMAADVYGPPVLTGFKPGLMANWPRPQPPTPPRRFRVLDNGPPPTAYQWDWRD